MENIEYTELLITNQEKIDEIILKYAKTTNLEIKIEKKYYGFYYNFPNAENEYQEIITKDRLNNINHSINVVNDEYNFNQIDESLYNNFLAVISKYDHDLEVYTSLNFDEINDIFDYSDFSRFYMYEVENGYYKNILNSLKENISNAQTEAQSKIVFYDFLSTCYLSQEWLKKYLSVENKDRKKYFPETLHSTYLINPIREFVANLFLKLSTNIINTVENDYRVIFPEVIEDIKQKSNTIIYQSPENKKLKDAKNYKLLMLIAQGNLSFDRSKGTYKGKEYENQSELVRDIAKELNLEFSSLQPYINQTQSNILNSKNLFYKSQIKYFTLIIDEYNANSQAVSDYFLDKFNELERSII